MKQTIESTQPSPEQEKKITLDGEKLKIVDQAKLESGLAHIRSIAENAVNTVDLHFHDKENRRNVNDGGIYNGLIQSALESIRNADKLGIETADLKKRLNPCIEEE